VRGVDVWTLFLSAVAAISGVAILAWAWLDRPRLSLALYENELLDEGRRVLELYAEGRGVLHSVSVSGVDCVLMTDKVFAMQMSADSQPLRFEVLEPEEVSRAAIIIVWTRQRPYQHQGLTIGLAEGRPAWDWRWRWTSLRWRNRRLARVAGHWVQRIPQPRPAIPRGSHPEGLGAA
jgi:hypothetical protein